MRGSAGTEPVPGQSRRSSAWIDFPGGSVTGRLDRPARSPKRKTGQKGGTRVAPARLTEAYRSVGGHSPPCHSWARVVRMAAAERLVIVTVSTRPLAVRRTWAGGATPKGTAA